MPYIPPEVVARAREMDLLTYLRTYEPQELVHSPQGNTERPKKQFIVRPGRGCGLWGRTPHP